MVANGDGESPPLMSCARTLPVNYHTRLIMIVAPFVGHNAFLRWSALQECAQPDPEDGVSRIWYVYPLSPLRLSGIYLAILTLSLRSESHVSEDFQIALTLQSKGWMLRWATYSNQEFEEGVSLSAIDELSRWSKYSFGCS